MNVWILNHLAGAPGDPQIIASYEHGRALVAKGHAVTIFASSFSHRQRREIRLQPGETWKVETHDGVRFVWVRTSAYTRNDWRRAVNMLAFGLRAAWVGARMRERPDVIVGTSPHPLAVAAAWALSVLKRARFFFEVRDLWPETVVDSRVLSSRNPVTIGLRILERFLFRRAERIIAVMPRLTDYTRPLGIADERVCWIPNSVDLARFVAHRDDRRPAGDVFTVMYVGGFARYNGVATIVEAAELLQAERVKDVRFVLVGDGPERPALVERAASRQLTLVEFLGAVPKAEVPLLMAAADAFIYVVRNLPVLRYGVSPQKLFEYMAVGRPVIFSADAANNPVEEAGAGLSVRSEDPAALAQAVLQVASMSPEERARMGERGVEYVKRHHDLAVLGARLERLIVGAPGRGGA